MKTSPFQLSLLTTCISLFACDTLSQLHAADEREWMSRQGGTLLATLGSISGDQVILVTPESREIKLKTSDLSLADRQHLIEFGGADASIIAAGDPGTPEKDLRLDAATMKKLDFKLALGDETEGDYDLFQTNRFWIGSAGNIRPNALAETAERLWHGMAFQHMNFRKDWGDRRMLILAVQDRSIYTKLGKWAQAEAGKIDPNAPNRIAATWDRVGATQINLPSELAEKHKLLPRALVFNITDDTRYKKAMGPFQINCISGFLLTHQMGGVSSFSSEGYYAVSTGHAYYKEILLGGKSETNQLAVEGSQDDVSSKAGFEDGRSWARTLRAMVRKGDVKLDLAKTLSWAAGDLDPTKLVTIYAFGYYLQSDAKRLSAFSQMVRRIESSNQIPEPIEIVRIFGHETVEAFNADWTEFVLKGNFR